VYNLGNNYKLKKYIGVGTWYGRDLVEQRQGYDLPVSEYIIPAGMKVDQYATRQSDTTINGVKVDPQDYHDTYTTSITLTPTPYTFVYDTGPTKNLKIVVTNPGGVQC